MSSSDVQALCRSCGLCCNGALFARVPLDPAEAQRLLSLGIPGTAQTHLSQPCAALRDTECSAYSQRPRACQRYFCMLATAVSDDETSLDEALALVRRATALHAATRCGENIPVVPGATKSTSTANSSPGPSPKGLQAIHDRDVFLKRHFLAQRDWKQFT